MSNQQVDNNNLRKAESQLPGFMSDNSSFNYGEDTGNSSWLNNNLNKLMIGFSTLWFVIVLIYITQFFGWSNLFLMMPDEFGGFLAGVTLPLAIIWVVMAYIDRGTSFKNEAKFLRAYMNQLVYPEDDGAKTAKAMADAIRSQVSELHEVIKYATKQTENIKTELGNRVADFANLVNTLDNYSSQTISQLSDGVKTLVENFDYINNKAENSTNVFKTYISDFSNQAVNMEENYTKLFSKIVPHIQELQSSSQLLESIVSENENKMARANQSLIEVGEKANDNVAKITSLLDSHTSKLEEVAGSAITVCDNLYKKIDGGVNKIDAVLGSQIETVEGYLDKIDVEAEKIADKFSNHSEVVALELDKVIARSGMIEESVAVQVSQLQTVADKVKNSITEVSAKMDAGISDIEVKSDNIITTMRQVVRHSEENGDKVDQISHKTIESIEKMSADINGSNQTLQTASDNVLSNLDKVSNALKGSISSLHTHSEVAKNRLEEIGTVVKKHTDNLTEATSIVVAQSKVGESALLQQQKNISNSLSKIEEIKTNLKYQIDELTRSALIMSEDAKVTVENLKNQMTETLNACDEVVSRTKLANDSLSEQSAMFNSSADTALSKVTEMDSMLNSRLEAIDTVTKTVVERSSAVADVLEKQAANINVATANTDNTFKQISHSFAEQNKTMSGIAEDTVNHVAGVVQILDEKAENINLLFKQQENEFFNICNRLTENTDNMGNTLKKQVSVIEQNADKVFARMTLLEEDVNKRVEAVVANSVKSIDIISEVNQSIMVQNNDVSNFIQEITDKLSLISDTFRANFQSFNDTVKDLTMSSDNFTGALQENCNRINTASQNLASESKNTAIMLDSHFKVIDETLLKTISQSELINQTFEHQKETISDIVNVLSTQTRLGEASLAQQYKYLTDTSTEVYQRLNDINTRFKDNTDNIFEVSAKVAYEFNVLGDRLLKVNEDINKSAKDSIKNVEKVNISLSNLAEDLDDNVNKSSAKISGVMKDYENYIANFNTVTAEASSGVFEINNLISDQSDKMIKISEDTKQLVECFNTVLNDTSIQLSNRANMAYDKVKGLGENLKVLSMQMEEATKMSSTHFENSGNKLRAALGEVTTNAERISNEIRSSGEVFLKQSGVLVAATDDTLKKVTDVMDVLNSSTNNFSNRGDEIIKKSVNFSDVINKQLKMMLETSQKAENKVADLEKRYENINIDGFLKNAAAIIENLETVSVDINRIFNPSSEEEIWKKYYNGDTAAFIRHLSKTMTKQQVMSIRSMYEKNLEFRNIVTRYLTEFETLIAKARNNERSGILLSVISGADIGKVYYILAKALDKLN